MQVCFFCIFRQCQIIHCSVALCSVVFDSSCTVSVSAVCLCRVPGFVDSRCPFACSECKLNLEDFKDATGPGPLLNGDWKCRKCLLLAADHPKQEPSGQPFSFGDARRWERGLCFLRALRVLLCGSGLLLLEVHVGGGLTVCVVARGGWVIINMYLILFSNCPSPTHRRVTIQTHPHALHAHTHIHRTPTSNFLFIHLLLLVHLLLEHLIHLITFPLSLAFIYNVPHLVLLSQ